MIRNELLSKARSCLVAAASGEDRVSERHMAEFMQLVAEQRREADSSEQQTTEVRQWAAEAAGLLVAAWDALSLWSLQAGYHQERGSEEEHALEALRRRTQRECARDLFQGTDAATLLDACADAEVDAELHQLAVDFHLTPDDWVPRTHTWWWWPEDGQGE